MFRKCAAALVAIVFSVGAIIAAEVKGTFVKFDEGKLTVKVEDKEQTFKVPADLKVKGRKGEVAASEMLGKVKGNPTLILDVEKDEVKNLKIEFKKKDAK